MKYVDCYVYLIIDTRDQTVLYVGSGSDRRLYNQTNNSHRGDESKVDKFDHSIYDMVKFLECNGTPAEFRIVADHLTKSQSLRLEENLARHYGSRYDGTGTTYCKYYGNSKSSDYCRSLMSKAKKGKGTGADNPMYGRKHSDETLRKTGKHIRVWSSDFELLGEFICSRYACEFINNELGIQISRSSVKRLASSSTPTMFKNLIYITH